MSRVMRRLRAACVAAVMVCGSAASAEAGPIYIGNFSWTTAADDTATLAIDEFGLDAWPVDVLLTGLFVDFTTSGGSSGQAYFDGSFDTCSGNPIAFGAGSGFVQVPGDFSVCGSLEPIPQDILSATLNFSYDTSLGAITVGALGPALIDGLPSFELQPIFFEAVEHVPVPEPATLMLVGAGAALVGLRQRRRTRI